MKLLKVLKISRPAGYLIGPLIFLVPVFLYDISFNAAMIIQLTLLTFPLCFLFFGINDVYDIKTDMKNPRKGGIEGAVLKKKETSSVLSIAAVCAVLMFIPALIRSNALNLAAIAFLVLLGYAYSAPPLRLKEKPPLDSFSNAVIIYLISLMGLSYGPGISAFPEAGYYLLFGVMGIHIFSTIMDYTPDMESSITTFATILGKRLAALMSFLIAGFILLFSAIQNIFINIFIFAFAIISITALVKPDEKLARNLFRVLFGLFILLSFAYLLFILS